MTRDSRYRFIWTCIFGLSMGYFEASVVVYLRGLYYPEGFGFPLKPLEAFNQMHLAVEAGREAMSIVMLLSVAMLAGRRPLERFILFLCAFGVWDIFYYLFLYVALGWPESLTTWDVLFMLPLPWIGPVWSAAVLAVLFVVTAMIHLLLEDSGRPLKPTIGEWAVAIAGALVIVYSFCYEGIEVGRGAMPHPYPWWWWVVGTGMGIAAFGRAIRRAMGKKR
ncbi:hypothetical protein LLG95_11975 [bacterium]|nr:hypothetical protein [bacterium]